MVAKITSFAMTRPADYLQFKEWQHIKTTSSHTLNQVLGWIFETKIYLVLQLYMMVFKHYLERNIGVFSEFSWPSNDKIIQISWLGSHFLTVLTTLSLTYSLLAKGIWEAPKYNVAVISAILTYTIVMYRHLVLALSSKESPLPLASIARSENMYIFIIAVITYNSRANIVKLLPFCLYSILNIYLTVVEDMLEGSLFSKPLAVYMGPLEDAILTSASKLEVLLLFIHAYDLALHRDKAFLPYLFVTVVRLESSVHLRTSVQTFLMGLHRLIESTLTEEQSLKLQQFIGARVSLPAKEPKKTRVASLNFETLHIVNDI